MYICFVSFYHFWWSIWRHSAILADFPHGTCMHRPSLMVESISSSAVIPWMHPHRWSLYCTMYESLRCAAKSVGKREKKLHSISFGLLPLLRSFTILFFSHCSWLNASVPPNSSGSSSTLKYFSSRDFVTMVACVGRQVHLHLFSCFSFSFAEQTEMSTRDHHLHPNRFAPSYSSPHVVYPKIRRLVPHTIWSNYMWALH